MICASCGNDTRDGLCHFHVSGESDWPRVNRIMCDLFHRGVEPRRLSETERFDGNIPNTSAEVDVPTFSGYE